MFYKLAFKNVSKSIRDYLVYFLTLTFGVCIFYVFNSIDSQQGMLQLSTTQHVMIEAMMQIIEIISIFISFILAFLILYANKFMIRRRKKELGTYMVLGMPKGKISMILIAETAVIGLISLAVGLMLGVFLSQGLAVVVAKLFEVQIRQFQFVFSPQACGKTVLYFAIIFVVVMLFNSITVSRCKLISLLNADRQNEKLKVKKLWVSVVLFLISAACLGGAYYLIMKNGMLNIDTEFILSLVLGTVGTFLFFMSLSGFLLRVLKSSKHIYLKNLNMFVLRQINSKINTTHFSMTFICIMLLLAIGILSVGGSFQSYLDNDISGFTPYDLTLECRDDLNYDIDAMIREKMSLDPDQLFESTYQFTMYDSGLTMQDVAKEYPALTEITEMPNTIFAMGLSDYNQLLSMMGKEPIQLQQGQYALVTIYEETVAKILNEFLSRETPLTIQAQEFTPAYQELIPLAFSDHMMSNAFSVVLPDDQVKALEPVSLIYNAQYAGDKRAVEEQIMGTLVDADGRPLNLGDDNEPRIVGNTRLTNVEMATGLKATMLFIAIYMGIIFLVASAAVLALQQLSEASDNASRYKLLGKLGVERSMMNHAIYAQVAIYFLIPLALALVHAFVGLSALSNTLAMQNMTADPMSMLVTAAFLVVIYGGYFLATCLGCKSIAKGKN